MPPQGATSLADRSAAVHRLADRLGFVALGIAPARPSRYAEHVRRWLELARHGDMDYMARDLEARLDPTRLLPGARSIIVAALAVDAALTDYDAESIPRLTHPPDTDPAAAPSTGPRRALESGGSGVDSVTGPSPVGRIARYARQPDYHRVLKKKLHRLADDLRELWPGHRFLTTVDTAPILEREVAALAGIGFIGKNTLLIAPRPPLMPVPSGPDRDPPGTRTPAPPHPSPGAGAGRGEERPTPEAQCRPADHRVPPIGSQLLLGEILTTLPLQSALDRGHVVTDHCGTCRRCIDACPTRCIDDAGWQLDATRCISYLSIEHRGRIDPALHPLMGDWIAGCDDCQTACPFNQVPAPAHARLAHGSDRPDSPPAALDLLDVLNWQAADRQRAVERSPLKRIKLEQWKRNALIAAGNRLATHDHPALRRRIGELADDPAEPELVRQTAEQVIAALPPRGRDG